MNIKRVFKRIKNSEVLTDKEKKEMIIKGCLELILNSWKLILKAPLFIIFITFAGIGKAFQFIGEVIDCISTIFYEILQKIDDNANIVLTNTIAREKILKEIKDNTIYKVK